MQMGTRQFCLQLKDVCGHACIHACTYMPGTNPCPWYQRMGMVQTVSPQMQTGTGHFCLQLDFVCDPVHRVRRFGTISSLLRKHQFAVHSPTLVTWDLTPMCRFSRPMKGWRNARELLIRVPRYNVDCTSTKPEKYHNFRCDALLVPLKTKQEALHIF